MRRVRNAAFAAVVLALLVSSAGCWDQVELDQQMHVLTGFMDLEEDGMIRFTVEVIGLLGGETAAMHQVISARGVSPGDAAARMTAMSEAPFSWFHLDLMVFGEDLARNGLVEIIDSMTQSYDVRRTIDLITVPGKASDLLSAALTSSRHAQLYSGMVTTASDRGGNHMSATLNGFRRDLATEGIDPTTRRIILTPAPDITHTTEPAQGMGNGGGGGGAGGAAAGGEEQKPPIAMINGMAIYRDGRLAGFAEEREAFGLEWLMSPISGRHLWVSTGPGMTGMGVWVYNSAPQIKVEEQAGQLVVRCGVTAELDIEEFATGGELATPADVETIEQLVADYITQEMEDGIAYAVGELGADPLGFGRYLSRYKPDLWDQLRDAWPAPLQQARFEVWSNANLLSTGMTRQKKAPAGRAGGEPR